MKTILQKKLQGLVLLTAAVLLFSFPVMAASVKGDFQVSDTGISGYAWNSQSADDIITVELHLYHQNSSNPYQVLHVTANQSNPDLKNLIGSESHWFQKDMNWSLEGGKPAQVKAYALTGTGKTQFGDADIADMAKSQSEASAPPNVESNPHTTASPKEETPAPSEALGPGAPMGPKAESNTKDRSLGIFTTTGYCTCSICSTGTGLTYSGTAPTEKHTISADLTVFPLGTKLMIGETVYTVEDKGGGINGRKLDIYYATHEGALGHGVKTQEVFAVE